MASMNLTKKNKASSRERIPRKASPISKIISLKGGCSVSVEQSETLIINKEEEILLKTFIKSIPAGIAIFDKKMNYIITSERWAEETNSTVTEVIGKNHYDLVPDVPARWRKLHERGLKGEHLKCEEDMFKRKDGSIEWLRWQIIPWYRSEKVIGGIILFVEHITKRKTMEKKMVEVIKALNKSNHELEKFAHICAHDLNEPLRTIASYSRIIEDEFKDEINPKAKKYIENISKSVKHMNHLVNGILAYSQFGASSLNKSCFSLQYLIDSIKMILDKKIKDKNAFIYSEKSVEIYGDIVLIARVFQNLISNALKFNESDIPIIYITVKEQKSGYLFCVDDNGIGIDHKYHKKIFDLFSRLHNKNKYEGTGIGLAISKKIIEAHGGKMWVKSTPFSGSQFYFTLPKHKPSD